MSRRSAPPPSLRAAALALAILAGLAPARACETALVLALLEKDHGMSEAR
jgi:hypothetical protein